MSPNGTVHVLLLVVVRRRNARAPPLRRRSSGGGRGGLERRDGAGVGESVLRAGAGLSLTGGGHEARQLPVAVGGQQPVLLQGGLWHRRGGRQPWVGVVLGRRGLTGRTEEVFEHHLVVELRVFSYPRT